MKKPGKPNESIAEITTGTNETYEWTFDFNAKNRIEVIDLIKEKRASHSYEGMRFMALRSIGAKMLENPDYLIITGCVRVFDSTEGLRKYFTLLGKLGIRYTILPTTEHCSTLPSLHTAKTDEEWEQAWDGARDVSQLNYDQGRMLGVKNLVFFCSDSYSVAKQVHAKFQMESEPLFYLDILADKIKEVKLKLPYTRIGFYPGCWRERRMVNDKLKVNVKGWLEMLRQIEGVEIIRLPAKECCKENTEAVVCNARDEEVDCIVTPCHGVGQAKFLELNTPSMTVSDILFKALEAAEAEAS